LERLKCEGAVPMNVKAAPFSNGRFPTPSGKVELYSQRLADSGVDPLPGNFVERLENLEANGASRNPDEALELLTGAAHHFVSSSLASQPGLLKTAGTPFLEIHPDDAARLGIASGDTVEIENGRGSCRLRALVTDAVRPGVVVSPKGRWAKH